MLRDFFYIRKSDRRILLSLLTVGIVALIVIFLAGGKSQKTFIPPVAVPDSLGISSAAGQTGMADSPQSNVSAELFAFDPNTADSAQLLRLGLPKSIVRNIYKYRSAGGVFSRKEDFARLYGLTVRQYRELEPYISISSDYQPASTLFPRHDRPESSVLPARRSDALAGDTSAMTPRHGYKLSPGETIELATADTSQLKRIPGIGPYFARRIVDYGRRLGGYVSLDQLDEIDDFPLNAKQYLTLTPGNIAKVNVNRLSLSELRRHPYINYYQARAIVDYRRRSGAITDLHQLRLLDEFSEEAIQRLLPYVEY